MTHREEAIKLLQEMLPKRFYPDMGMTPVPPDETKVTKLVHHLIEAAKEKIEDSINRSVEKLIDRVQVMLFEFENKNEKIPESSPKARYTCYVCGENACFSDEDGVTRCGVHRENSDS